MHSPLISLLDSRTATTGTPSITLNSPSNAGTVSTVTPTLTFTGITSTNDQNISYEIQIDSANTFDSVSGTTSLAQAAIVGTTGATFPTTLTSATGFANPLTIGNTVIIRLMLDGQASAQTTTMVDSAGNTYTRRGTEFLTSIDQVDIWQTTVTKTGAGVTVTAGGLGNTTASLIAEEWVGTLVFDKTTQALDASGTSTAINTGATATTTAANELVIVAASASSATAAFTVGSSYSGLTQKVSSPSTLATESKIVTSTGTQTGTFTLGAGAQWTAVICTFKIPNLPLIDASSLGKPFVVQTASGGASSGTTATATFTPAAGNTILVVAGSNVAGTVSVADNKSNSYSSIANPGTGLNSWYASGVVGASTTVTVTFPSGGATPIMIAEISGAGAVDVVSTVHNTSGTSHTSNVTSATTVANDLIVGVDYVEAATADSSVASPFTNLTTHVLTSFASINIASYVSSSLATQNVAFTGANTVYYTTVITFKPATNNFADVTNSGDTDPFPSSDQARFTIPAAEALINGNTYYWRVRQIVPPGNTNYLAAWSSTFSFLVNTTPAATGQFFQFF